jgi:ferric-dicitrate binding protein FerR (iron transport regulator)
LQDQSAFERAAASGMDNAMARKEVEESRNQTDMRSIRRHPKHDRFPVRRLGLAALLIVVVMILLVALPSPWPV